MCENSQTLPGNQKTNQVSRLLQINKSSQTMLEKENVMAVTVPHSKPVSAKRRGELASLPRKAMQRCQEFLRSHQTSEKYKGKKPD